MATPKKPQHDKKALSAIKSVLERCNATKLYQYNGNILIRDNEFAVLLKINHGLWMLMQMDDTIREQIAEASNDMVDMFRYLAEAEWLSLEPTSELYNGKEIRIRIDSYEYDIPITKELMPFRLKKAEYSDLTYRVVLGKYPILLIRKSYDYSEYSFYVVRAFRIV